MDRDIVEHAGLLPGVRRLLDHLAEHKVPAGICSGARRHEIQPLLAAFGIAAFFPVITAIEDVRYGKPDPEGYSKKRRNCLTNSMNAIFPPAAAW